MFNIDIIDSKTTLDPETKTVCSSLFSRCEMIGGWLNLNSRKLISLPLDLTNPLGNIYPLDNDFFLISCLTGL